MDLKLSISVLISSAYFLTLFLFKLFKSQDILSILIESGTCAFIVFVLLYSLFTYVIVSFEKLKRKEANDAIAQIRQLEQEQLARRNEAIKNKLSEIDKAVLEKEKQQKELEDSESEDDEDDNDSSEKAIKYTTKTVDTTDDEQDIEQLKKEAGTQFDSSFTADNIQI